MVAVLGKRCLLTLVLFCGLTLFMNQVEASDTEIALKAGFTFNFARYSEWSGQAALRGSFQLCSPDLHFVTVAEDVLAGQTVHGLPITVSHVELVHQAMSQCNLLFVSAAYRAQWQALDKHLFRHTMLVGETADFIKYGGHIRFFLLSGKIRFEVAPDALKEVGIVMSSKVLRLSRVISEGAQ